jgi:hypothetical protein
MEKQILEEINRYREIIGLKLITEAIGDEIAEMVSALIKNTDSITDDSVEAIARQIKKVAEADALAKKIDLDKYLDDMLITGKVSDDIVNLINKAILTNKGYTDVVRKLVKDTDPVLINIKNTILDNDAMDLIKMADSLDELKRLENDFLNDFKNHTDPFGNSLSDEMIALYKKDIDDATSSRRVELEAPGKIASEATSNAEKQVAKDAQDIIDKVKENLANEGKKLSRNVTVDEVVAKMKTMTPEQLIETYTKLQKNTRWTGFKNWVSTSVNPRIKRLLIYLKTSEIDEAGKLVIRPGMITLYASVLAAAYIAFDMYRTSESEWKELYDNLLALCPDEKLKDNQTASIAPDIKENDALRPDWVISVVYDSKKTSVFYEDGNWFLDVKSGKPGEEYLPLNCNDAKLANKTFGETGGEPNDEEKLKTGELNNTTKTLDDFKKSEKGVGYESTATEVSTGKFKRSPTSAMTYTWDATVNKFVGVAD